MDQSRLYEATYRIQHRHDDGSWTEFEEVRPHHDAADHDPERRWATRRLFRCTSCEESVELVSADEAGSGRPG